MYAEGFKELLGFDWTTNTDRTQELSYSGEPNIETVAKLLNLDLTSAQIKSANQLEELATTVQSNFEFAEYNQASVVAAEINMNPRFDAVGAQVVRTENGFTVQYKPTTENREKINLSDLRGLNFGDIVDHIGQVEEFDLMQMFSALENMSELEPFQAEIITQSQVYIRPIASI
jgi:Asp-tRNA(Asn)/Glu-tRNA(Gln) amidotransferase C subunit